MLFRSDYIKSLSNENLESLIDEQSRTDSHSYDNLMMMAEILATGEGCDVSSTVEEFKDRLEQLIIYLNFESLKRKGLVKIHYENLSFGDDMADKIVVERID